MSSSRLGRLCMAAAAAAAVAIATTSSVRGDLDRIAADGVTEHGGSPKYARMLPRTKSDGLLDASLLPPVADWASQPISNLYYASGNSGVQGNGSPQHPFNDLTHAFTNMAPDSALLLAPATYSGTLTLNSGRTLSLVGMGPGSYISHLAVAAGGSSFGTCLALVGVRVGTLSVTGGRINVSLADSTIAQLEGSSPYVTVTRTDLGSSVGVFALDAEDAYSGYDTVPKAEAVSDPVSADRLILSGGRALVTEGGRTHVVAYVSDIDASTNGIDTALRTLAATNSALAARIDAEAASRAAGDVSLSNSLDSAVASLRAQIGSVGTSWGGQLSTVSTALSNLRTELQALRVTESSDIASVNSAIASVRAACTNADAVLTAQLASIRADLTSLSSSLSATIDARAATVADSRINLAKPGIVSNAVATADTHINTAKSELTTAIATNVTALSSSIGAANNRITALRDRYNELIQALSSGSPSGSFTNYYHITLPSPLP